MAITPSYVTVNPNYMLPEIIMPFQQASGAFNLLAGNGPMVRLSEGDMAVYAKVLDVRTQVAYGQSAANQLPSAQITASMISTPTYLLRNRTEYDHHDQAAAGQWGVNLVEANRLALRQGHFQTIRNGLLGGFQSANGEGLLNTAGATSVTLPADSNGNTTLATYDNGELAFFFLGLISSLKTRTNQLGIGRKMTICGPQRILSAMEYQNIVQLVQFQRVGAGSASTTGVVDAVAEANSDLIEWCYDDSLTGQGAGGTDAVLINIPEIEQQNVNRIDTNEFAKLTPNLSATALLLSDMAAPREIPTPIAGGAIDIVAEMRVTPGWQVRPEALTILSIPFQ